MSSPVLQLRRATAGIGPSDIRKVGAYIAQRGLSPIRLDIGEPDLAPPRHVLEAAARAAAVPARYTPAAGTTAFREAVSEHWRSTRNVEIDPARVVVTTGATGGLQTAFLTLVDPGDEVLIPEPGFSSYRTQISLIGGVPIPYLLSEERGYLPDLDSLAAAIGPRTRAIVLNSPANPTGAIMPPRMLASIVTMCRMRGVAVISDEPYLDLWLDEPAASAVEMGEDGVIGVFSLSKTYALTGWRIGYLVLPPHLVFAASAVTAQLTASANAVAQEVAVAALRGDQRSVDHARSSYRARRDHVHRTLLEFGVPHVPPVGAFYQAIAVDPPGGGTSLELAYTLADDGVAVVPGSAFGEPEGPFLRLSLTTREELLSEALEILRRRLW